ncbi:MAG: glycoside hydrolase family 43 protein [Opitutaceae bacterium]|nr:glycoside hydrolase family 43 protein [Opitutaceae bacterium]
MATVSNPILPGFHPDPCIIRVGHWYYLATSTFEWWPGVRLHRSKDLANWELVGGILDRVSQLDLRGIPPSGGVWAPALSFHDGLFWLVYSSVAAFNGSSKDLRNFLVTAPAIDGPWTDPISLNASGFDPSLFHDADGRKWLVSQYWDARPGKNPFAGILLQEFDVAARRLIGEPKNIFTGSPIGITEGPHLYAKDGYYWLVTAEGGTGENHAVTVARSRTIEGPYELSPYHPLLSTSSDLKFPLQKSGHASFVNSPQGEWFLVHLCSRPVPGTNRCMLGRETALQRFVWPDKDWPRLASGGPMPELTVEISHAAKATPYPAQFRDDFNQPALRPEWNTLREPPADTWLDLAGRPGWLRLKGRHTLQSNFEQSLVGFRLLHLNADVSVTLDYAPKNWQQSAGLSLFYNSLAFISLHVTANDAGEREAHLVISECGKLRREKNPLLLPGTGPVRLAVALNQGRAKFFAATAGAPPEQVGQDVDATILSDDHLIENKCWAFTGTFITLSAHDASDAAPTADFQQFEYVGR